MKYSILSDVGQKRTNNQDYADTFVNTQGERIFLLADGMGGHKAGNVASKLTVEDLGRAWAATDFTVDSDSDEIEAWLRAQIRAENENIANLGKLDDYKGMGTTLEAVVVQKHQIVSAHVGDSRTQVIRNNELIRITRDHSLVQELVDAGEITADEAESHPNKNIITRSLGQPTDVDVDTLTLEIDANDVIIMSSDGLTNMVSEQEIIGIVENDIALDGQTDALVGLANSNGGLDNITVVLVKFDQGDL
ncbi:Stp1/IreP family PP2C-type Ser/Thr phosphatase [Pseudolactococcus insecticola]|uniref:protein-serine/threonine phosphatase n=1 Tax=Pseudolactococcus insecticola TaxID=2709158 RepID=A0A6A0B571_9LACT|nr:Stp1/IreP family PP2C-type Ser/Thr phosphatase [Lactococcus insecticola]GFH40530.1 serine/threonine phosphatase [Lactococcus insecticola]